MRGEQVLEQKSLTIQEIGIIGIFTALTFLFTMINVKLPFGQGGLIHLGNIPLFLGASLFGKRAGSIIGGVGMALFDLLNGWVAWAPFTFVIVGLMGFTVGAITSKKKTMFQISIAILIALIIKVIGYYITEVILYHNWISPATSILGNIMQVVVAGILVFLIITPVKKIVDILELNKS